MVIDVAALRRIPLFSSLNQEDLAHVSALVVERRYERGDIILLEGSPGGGLFYVQSGLVKVFKTSTGGREQVLRLVGAGYTFNDVPALDGGPNPASAAAVEPSTLYLVQHTMLLKLITTRPEMAVAAVQTLASALRHLVSLVEDLSLRHVTARVAKILLDQETQRTRHLTQQEMAALAGTVREVVARSLKELEMAGAIVVRQGQVIVLDRERLRLLVSG
jgi:CRP/FNR family transcriptional regulator